MANSNPSPATRFGSGDANPARQRKRQRIKEDNKLERLHATASTSAILHARLRSLRTPASSLGAIAAAYKAVREAEAGDAAHQAQLDAKDALLAERDAELDRLRAERIVTLQAMLDVDRTTPVAGGAQFAADGVAPIEAHPRADSNFRFFVCPISELADAELTPALRASVDRSVLLRDERERRWKELPEPAKVKRWQEKAEREQPPERRRSDEKLLDLAGQGIAWLSMESAARSKTPEPPYSAFSKMWRAK